MKRVVAVFSGCLFFVVTISAQKLSAAQVPDVVTAAFAKAFPDTPARWEKEKSSFEAGFKKDGHSVSVLFSAGGTLMETETEIAVSSLPVAVPDYVKANYKGAVIKEGAQIVKADGTVNYEAEVNKKDLLFDKDGHFIQAVKE